MDTSRGGTPQAERVAYIHARVPIVGGNWNNGANSGVFALNLNNARSNVNTNIGARPDYDPSLTACIGTVDHRDRLSCFGELVVLLAFW